MRQFFYVYIYFSVLLSILFCEQKLLNRLKYMIYLNIYIISEIRIRMCVWLLYIYIYILCIARGISLTFSVSFSVNRLVYLLSNFERHRALLAKRFRKTEYPVDSVLSGNSALSPAECARTGTFRDRSPVRLSKRTWATDFPAVFAKHRARERKMVFLHDAPYK